MRAIARPEWWLFPITMAGVSGSTCVKQYRLIAFERVHPARLPLMQR